MKRKTTKLVPIQLPATPIVPPTPPPAPEPPNPVVLALQEQILGLVNQRTSLQDGLVNANAQLRSMQAVAESARERLQMVESEVRYRMGLINEMLGKPVRQNDDYDHLSVGIPPGYRPSSLVAGVGSIPPRPAPMAGTNDGVRTESAEEIRSML